MRTIYLPIYRAISGSERALVSIHVAPQGVPFLTERGLTLFVRNDTSRNRFLRPNGGPLKRAAIRSGQLTNGGGRVPQPDGRRRSGHHT